MEPNHLWHTRTLDQAFAQLQSRPAGLGQSTATERAATYGPNEIQAAQRVSAWQILLDQFKNVLILILLGATVYLLRISVLQAKLVRGTSPLELFAERFFAGLRRGTFTAV